MSAVIFSGAAEAGGRRKGGRGKSGQAGEGRPAGSPECLPLEAIKAYSPEAGRIAYVDLAGLDEAEARKAVAALRKRCTNAAWGVIDPESAVDDPASLFHEGASDYIGAALASTGVSKQRIKAALAYRSGRLGAPEEGEASAGPAAAPTARDDAEYRNGFKGWSSLKAGSVYPFYFLYASVGGPTNLKTRLGEAGFAALRERIKALLQQALAESNPLLWMETESNSLYLLPPSKDGAESAVQALLRLLLSTPLVGYEKIGLPFPVEFTFALHRGKTEFAQPGRTGTIVSDAVNFIFHLGAKRAASSSLTMSSEAAAVPTQLSDLFVDDGEYEGRRLVRSRRFG